MAIANIRSNLRRRAVLFIVSPFLLPLQAVCIGVLAAWEDIKDWPSLVAGVWRGSV